MVHCLGRTVWLQLCSLGRLEKKESPINLGFGLGWLWNVTPWTQFVGVSKDWDRSTGEYKLKDENNEIINCFLNPYWVSELHIFHRQPTESSLLIRAFFYSDKGADSIQDSICRTFFICRVLAWLLLESSQMLPCCHLSVKAHPYIKYEQP